MIRRSRFRTGAEGIPIMEPKEFRDRLRSLSQSTSKNRALQALDGEMTRSRMKDTLVELRFSDTEADAIIEILARRRHATDASPLAAHKRPPLSRRIAHHLAVKKLGKGANASERESLKTHYYNILIGVLGNAVFAGLVELLNLAVQYAPKVNELFLHIHHSYKTTPE